MSIFVGLDCGGTSTRVRAVDASGSTVFQGQSGAANLASTPIELLETHLRRATDGCPDPDFVCGCFAGLVDDDQRGRATALLRQRFPMAAIRAEADYAATLAASPSETNVCVIAGTGSLVCSRDAERIRVSGGRGYLLGDAGSAFQYGRDALRQYLDHPNEASEKLRAAVRENFGEIPVSAIVTAVYRLAAPASTIARLAGALAADAKVGLEYAVMSVETNSGQLADVVANHIKEHFPSEERVNVIMAGGVWNLGSIFRERFRIAVKSRLPDREVELCPLRRAPVEGAVELAREMEKRG